MSKVYHCSLDFKDIQLLSFLIFLDPYISTTLVLCSLRLLVRSADPLCTCSAQALFAVGWIYPQIDIEGHATDNPKILNDA